MTALESAVLYGGMPRTTATASGPIGMTTASARRSSQRAGGVRRCRCGRRRRRSRADPLRRWELDDAELEQQAHLVEHAPALVDLAVCEPVNEDAGDVGGASCRADTVQLAQVGATGDPAGDNLVAVGDLILEGHAEVGKGRPVGQDGFFQVASSYLVAVRLVLDVVLAHGAVDDRRVASIPRGVEEVLYGRGVLGVGHDVSFLS